MNDRIAVSQADVPDVHKVTVYEAIRKHFETALSSYFTERGWADPRYTTGGAEPQTECVGISLDPDGLYIVMAIAGYADLQGFHVDLPHLDKSDLVDDGTVLPLFGLPD